MVDLSDDSGPYSPGTKAPYSEKEVNHQTGLEVDHTQEGLRTVLDTAGLDVAGLFHRRAEGGTQNAHDGDGGGHPEAVPAQPEPHQGSCDH